MARRTVKEQEILDILKDLPSDKREEVVDFARYLKTKPGKRLAPGKKPKRIKVPTFHLGRIKKDAFDRSKLYGEHLDHKLD